MKRIATLFVLATILFVPQPLSLGQDFRVPASVVDQADTSTLVVTRTGVYRLLVDADGVPVAVPWAGRVIRLDRPGPTPDPDDPTPDPDDPEPDPDLPDDFDNLATKVQGWAAGLPKTLVVGKVYADVAKRLESGELLSINEAAKDLVQKRGEVLGDDAAKWSGFGTNLTADFSKRWEAAPMTRGVVVDYWRTVAAGLGVTP